ncbi:Copper resistance protein B [hydrothermal vent metagenome]|uniref:Copper resistance protein B n=1 Tax=hydrothermal vent metagenome TaxID=652676 RepID=A0A1W1BX64_9ZZZZ
MKSLKIISLLLVSSFVFAGGVEDDPILAKVMGEVEAYNLDNGDRVNTWDVESWIGKDLHKVWLKIESKEVDGVVEDQEFQLLYSKAIAPFWDIQFGVRKDIEPRPQKEWGVVALKGLTPYLFETDASLFLGKNGQAAIRLKTEYEYMFSQKLILSPDIEMNIYNKDDTETDIGKGLSDISMGIRLRYELHREFAPYLGIIWNKKYGNTADMADVDGEITEDFQTVIGLRFWF